MNRTSLSALFLLSACADLPRDGSAAADTVLINGNIITVDPEDSIARAVAIRDGIIVAVGSDGEVRGWIDENTRVIDLNGLTATPGMIDTHCHFAGGALETLRSLDLDYPKVRKIDDMVRLVKQRVEDLEPGEWVLGKGWDEGKLKELRYVYASDIDPVTPNNPVWLLPTMGHYGTANRVALKLANITKDTPDPPGGTIDRRPDGTPTGLLKESAMALVGRLIPPLSPEQKEEGLIRFIGEFNGAGMTAVKDPGIHQGLWDLYRKVHDRGKLNVRVFVLWRTGKTVEAAERLIRRIGPFTKPHVSTGDDRLISGGVKIGLDGSGGARTAWVYRDWNKKFTGIDKGNRGYPVTPPDVFREQARMFHRAGLHMGVHAIGDRAIDWTVDTFAGILEDRPTRGLRHTIIHCNIPTDHAVEVMEALQKKHDAGYPELQSTFMWWIGDTYAGNFGPERCRRFMPFKTYVDRGMKWGGGSDFNVTPFEATYGIWATVTRKPLQGSYGDDPYGREQSVDVRAALRSYTLWNAHLLFMEDKIGSIEPGKYADIAVWDRDLYTIPVDAIKDLRCEMTLLAGKIVHRNPKSAVSISRGSK